MKKQVVKLGVVGLGRGREVTIELLDDKNVKIAAICDKNPELLQKAIDDYTARGFSGFEVYNTFDEMIAQADIDAVYIATDAIYHVPYVIKALDAGKHVLSEIPPVNSVEEARELKAAVLRHPELKYMAGENCCYWAFIEAWKGMYDEGKVGKAVYAEAEYIHALDITKCTQEDYPQDHWRQSIPAIIYLTHDLGPLLYIMDDECVSVSCMEPDHMHNPYRSDKNAVAIFKTKKGAVIRILIIFDAYAGFDHNFAIIGTKGTLETDKTKPMDDAHTFARFMDVPGTFEEKIDIPVTTRFPNEHLPGYHGGADLKMMRAFIKCIIDDTEPPIDVDTGIRMTIPGLIAAESAKNGGQLMEIPQI